MGTAQSDFVGFNPDKAKRHLERCLFKNGAAECECPLRYATATASSASHYYAPQSQLRTFGLLAQSFESPILSVIRFKTKKPGLITGLFCFNGAAEKNRTFDPVITNDVLYH